MRKLNPQELFVLNQIIKDIPTDIFALERKPFTSEIIADAIRTLAACIVLTAELLRATQEEVHRESL